MLTLRPLNKKDIFLIARWLYEEHVASWIDSPEDWLAEIQDSDSLFTHAIVEVNGSAMAYCRFRKCGYTEYDVGYLIGALEYIPKGFDRVMLNRMLALLKAQGATSVSITPEKDDRAARQLLESCCFLWDGGFYSYFFSQAT